MSKWSPFGTFKPGDLRVLGLGLELAVAIGGLGLLGFWADGHFGTSPWLSLTGIILGTVGGCWNIYKTAKQDGFFKQNKTPKAPHDAGASAAGDKNNQSHS